MNSCVFTFGLNHHSAPVAIREKVSLGPESVRPAIDAIRSTFGKGLEETAILSTCNRTEFYCSVNSVMSDDLLNWMADYHALSPEVLKPHLFQLKQDQAVRHTFRVASGLDSMVLGETQILGQMKKAVAAADEAGSLGSVLHQLFQKTFSVAKEVRSQTAIGSESISMAAAAVRLCERVFGDIHDCRVLFIGAGEMIELCAAHFSGHQPKSITVANRTQERAQVLASQYNGDTLKLADLPDELHKFDIIVSCTASSLPILGLGLMQKVIKERRHQPIVMVDLAVPRDIEPEVASISDIYLYTVDDLGVLVQQGEYSRKAAVVEAEQIIDSRVQNFMHWMQSRSIVPLIKDLNMNAEALRQIEMEKAMKQIAAGESVEMVLDRLSKSLTQKYLHAPMSLLNKSNTSEREQLLAWVPKLFPSQQDKTNH
ncbi:glutamyl-tRNA reductase [Basilea psittacipulmonis]|uniref:Glutamyl-tRNA reductase n=1 Tax=Basilea psittacipulmonis DSM 24701 TaxID=1072685 RepID=A0A077DB05_9BURK|nr:glutamyl-tRNA reductase [Basilea psittacipulmonis]AIL32070.1 glutamyl-tRNA reductase [Basilea psittacipulmonis DSM 24701]